MANPLDPPGDFETLDIVSPVSDIVVLHSRCHPDSPTWASLWKERPGKLLLSCAECGRQITVFDLAKGN